MSSRTLSVVSSASALKGPSNPATVCHQGRPHKPHAKYELSTAPLASSLTLRRMASPILPSSCNSSSSCLTIPRSEVDSIPVQRKEWPDAMEEARHSVEQKVAQPQVTIASLGNKGFKPQRSRHAHADGLPQCFRACLQDLSKSAAKKRKSWPKSNKEQCSHAEVSLLLLASCIITNGGSAKRQHSASMNALVLSIPKHLHQC